jgi:hypothetical protein
MKNVLKLFFISALLIAGTAVNAQDLKFGHINSSRLSKYNAGKGSCTKNTSGVRHSNLAKSLRNSMLNTIISYRNM